ncbi:unnamed protein product [Musa hybrid cultivar]
MACKVLIISHSVSSTLFARLIFPTQTLMVTRKLLTGTSREVEAQTTHQIKTNSYVLHNALYGSTSDGLPCILCTGTPFAIPAFADDPFVWSFTVGDFSLITPFDAKNPIPS